MSSTVFQVWANTDMDGAGARIKELDEQTIYSIFLVGTLLTTRDDLSLERMREIAVELGEGTSAFTYYYRNLVKGDIEKPRDTWYEIINIANHDSVQNTTGTALSRVAAAWIEEKGLEVLDESVGSQNFTDEQFDTLKQYLSDADRKALENE